MSELKKKAYIEGAGLYIKILPRSRIIARILLKPIKNFKPIGEFARIIEYAEKKDHPLCTVLQRLGKEINPRCRKKFLKHHIPLLLDKKNGSNKFFPRVIIISVTSKCNYKCPDCFNNNLYEEDKLDSDTLNRVLSEAEEKGTIIVPLSGGEPIMRRDLLEIIERHPGLYFQLFTNGSLVTEKIAQQLSKLGNVMPFISIEGDQDLTDKRRGVGNYNRAVRAMKSLGKNGVIFGANVMITPNNLEGATSEEFITTILGLGGLAIWYITYRPIGKEPDFDLILSKKLHRELFEHVQKIRNKYPIVALENLYDPLYFGGCPGKLGLAIHIDHRGNVTPCPPIHFSNSHILNQSLEEALDNSPLIKDVMRWRGKGCLILDEPEKLLKMVKSNKASMTGNGVDKLLLDQHIKLRQNSDDLQDDSESNIEDLYRQLKEVVKNG